QPWFGPEHSLRQDPTLTQEFVEPSVVAGLMGLEFVTAYSTPSARWVNFEADRTQSMPIEGYDRLLPGHFVNEGDGSKPFEGSDIGYRVSKGLDTMIVELRAGGKVEDTAVVSLRPIIDKLLSRYDSLMTKGVPPEVMTASASAPKFRVKVCIRDLNLDRRQQPVAVTSYSLVMLYARTERGL
ncbi:MAG TPA: hypothetical protein VMS71_02455, partial [Candidatus Acidoferrum sp.]|nr:hypothetical protein [Candidatus Acidoferrum sp.]